MYYSICVAECYFLRMEMKLLQGQVYNVCILIYYHASPELLIDFRKCSLSVRQGVKGLSILDRHVSLQTFWLVSGHLTTAINY